LPQARREIERLEPLAQTVEEGEEGTKQKGLSHQLTETVIQLGCGKLQNELV